MNNHDKLMSLIREINDTYEASQSAVKLTRKNAAGALAEARICGQKLIEAKELCQHGEWLQWLSDHTVVSERTASNYMRLARAELVYDETSSMELTDIYKLIGIKKSPSNRQPVSDLQPTPTPTANAVPDAVPDAVPVEDLKPTTSVLTPGDVGVFSQYGLLDGKTEIKPAGAVEADGWMNNPRKHLELETTIPCHSDGRDGGVVTEVTELLQRMTKDWELLRQTLPLSRWTDNERAAFIALYDSIDSMFVMQPCTARPDED